MVSQELENSEDDIQGYQGTLKAAGELEQEKTKKTREVTDEAGTEWKDIGKFLGVSAQAAQQAYEKIKTKLQTFQDGEFDASEYKSIAENMIDIAARLAFKSVTNAIDQLSTVDEDVEGVLSAEIQKFTDTLVKVLKQVAKTDETMSEAEKMFWSNTLTSALDMVLENEEVRPADVIDYLYDTAETEFFRGWDDAGVKQLSDTIREKRREVVLELSKHQEESAPEGVELVRQAAPDIGAASTVIMDHAELFPEVVNSVADELRDALHLLAEENSQSAIQSIQNTISKSIFFPEAKRGRKPKAKAD